MVEGRGGVHVRDHIAEVGVPGLTIRPENPSAALPDICRSNLLAIDGKPIDIRVVGTVGEAETL